MFITFEGPEGSGKTSQIPLLAQALRARGLKVLTTREPGGTPIGDQVRAILMELENKTMHPRTEILLFCASRAQHVEELIRPALGRGEIVLCDRYADSTLAYQGYGHGVSLEELRSLLRFATGGLVPDLTVLLDLPVEDGLRRRRQGGDWNRLDDYEVEFHRRVRQGYLELAGNEPERWRRIDASQPFEQVQLSLSQVVIKFLNL